jgi:hypothetical protein
VVWTVEPTGPGAPKGGGKDDDGQQKEDAGDFKPEDASHAAEGAQKAAYAAGEALGSVTGSLTGGTALGGG